MTGTPQTRDNVMICFPTDNLGLWFLHCRIDFHFEAGFAAVMAEDSPNAGVANPAPQVWSGLYPTYNALSHDD